MFFTHLAKLPGHSCIRFLKKSSLSLSWVFQSFLDTASNDPQCSASGFEQSLNSCWSSVKPRSGVFVFVRKVNHTHLSLNNCTSSTFSKCKACPFYPVSSQSNKTVLDVKYFKVSSLESGKELGKSNTPPMSKVWQCWDKPGLCSYTPLTSLQTLGRLPTDVPSVWGRYADQALWSSDK